MTLPSNVERSLGWTRTLPANAGSPSGLADSVPPRGPCGIAAIDSLALMSLLAHAAVARPGGGSIALAFGGGGGSVGGRRVGPDGASSVCAIGLAFDPEPDDAGGGGGGVGGLARKFPVVR